MFTVRVPATIANMGPGFDSFGMAVTLYNRFHFAEAERDALLFSGAGTADTGDLEAEAGNNIIFGAMNQLYEHVGKKRPPIQVTVEADIPVARGLGSSSTAIVAGLMAANQFSGKPLDDPALLDFGIGMEGHPDNVAPTLLGGIVLYDTRAYRLPWPAEWRVLTLSPHYPVMTEEARRILPKTVSLEDSIFNLRKASVLTYALLKQDAEALRESLQDRLHQPYRRKMIKEYDAIENTVLSAGALGMIVSGSGSTMAVFYPVSHKGHLLESLQDLIQAEGFQVDIQDLTADPDGATLLMSNSLA